MDMQSSQSQASVCGSTSSMRSIEHTETTTPLSGQLPPSAATNHPIPPPVAQVAGKKRKEPANKSPVWEYFTKCKLPNGAVDPQWCTCNYCNERVLYDKLKNGTSSMWNHSKKCNQHTMSEKKNMKQAKLVVSNVSGGSGYHKYNKKMCDDRCIEMKIKDELPFRFVEKEGFIAFCKEMEPNWKPLDRKQIAKGVLDKYNLEKATLMSQMKENQTRVSITANTWTSIQNINYMVLTVHFLGAEWKLHKRIINFCNITSHKGEDISRMIEQCLRQWEITKVFTITMDNASVNDKVVEYMKRRLKMYKTLMFDGDFSHKRCSCHIINLIVKDGLKDLETGIAAI